MLLGPAIIRGLTLPLEALNGALDDFFSESLIVAGYPQVVAEPRQDVDFGCPGEGAGGFPQPQPQPPNGLIDHGGHLHLQGVIMPCFHVVMLSVDVELMDFLNKSDGRTDGRG